MNVMWEFVKCALIHRNTVYSLDMLLHHTCGPLQIRFAHVLCVAVAAWSAFNTRWRHSGVEI